MFTSHSRNHLHTKHLQEYFKKTIVVRFVSNDPYRADVVMLL